MPPFGDHCSDSLQDFLKSCFTRDPRHRPSADNLLEHEWLAKQTSRLQESKVPSDIPLHQQVTVERSPTSFHSALRRNAADMSSSLPQKKEGRGGAANPLARIAHDSTSSSEHVFVRTVLSKPVECRVCHQDTRKSAVFCDNCSFIAHSRCASSAPRNCGTRRVPPPQVLNRLRPLSTPNLRKREAVSTDTEVSPTQVVEIRPRTKQDSSPTRAVVASPTPSKAFDQSPVPSNSNTPLVSPSSSTASKVFAAFKRNRSKQDSD